MSQVQSQSPVKKAPINIAMQQKKDAEMVKGVFKDYEVPGGNLSFSYRKYKGEDITRYDMIDGHVYTIPRGVAKHLNSSCWYPEYDHIKGEGSTNYAIKKKVHRFGFQSLEFMDEDAHIENEQKIIEVTRQSVAL